MKKLEDVSSDITTSTLGEHPLLSPYVSMSPPLTSSTSLQSDKALSLY